LIKEANLAFALNTHLFSLIRPDSSLVPRNPPRKAQPELRYYEKRELERLRKEKERLEREGPVVPNTWREMIERFGLFAVAVIMGVLITQVVLPYLSKVVGPILRSAARKGL